MTAQFAQAGHGLYVGGTNRGGQGTALSLTMQISRGSSRTAEKEKG